jgi:aryl-alcohol dehydrogenase-like predicted oxidoreductase
VKVHEGPLSDDNLAVVERLAPFAERRGRSMVQLAIAWIAAHRPVASVIAGATSPPQVHANVGAADWVLDDADLAEIETLLT